LLAERRFLLPERRFLLPERRFLLPERRVLLSERDLERDFALDRERHFALLFWFKSASTAWIAWLSILLLLQP